MLTRRKSKAKDVEDPVGTSSEDQQNFSSMTGSDMKLDESDVTLNMSDAILDEPPLEEMENARNTTLVAVIGDRSTVNGDQIASIPLSQNISTSRQNVSNVESLQRDYSLNVKNAIEKKLAATDRPTYEVLYKKSKNNKNDHGCYVVTFSTGGYEIFKLAVLEYYEPLVKRGTAVVKEAQDKKGNKVEVSIQVKRKPKHSKPINSYTINMYHTQSKITVNGKENQQFSNVLDAILKKIDLVNVNSVNEMLKHKLIEAQNLNPSPTVSSVPGRNSTPSSIVSKDLQFQSTSLSLLPDTAGDGPRVDGYQDAMMDDEGKDTSGAPCGVCDKIITIDTTAMQ